MNRFDIAWLLVGVFGLAALVVLPSMTLQIAHCSGWNLSWPSWSNLATNWNLITSGVCT